MRILNLLIGIMLVTSVCFAETYYVCEFLTEDAVFESGGKEKELRKKNSLISEYTVDSLDKITKEAGRKKKIVTQEKYNQITEKYIQNSEEVFDVVAITEDAFPEEEF